MRKSLKLAGQFAIDMMVLDLFHAAVRGLVRRLRKRGDGAA